MERKSLAVEPVFFDLETQKTFEEVDNDYTKLGFSVAVVRQAKKNHIYYEKDAQELIRHLMNAELVVGHNHIHFDYTVLRGYGLTDAEVNILVEKSYDTLAEIRKIVGERVSLEHLSKHNLKGRPGKLAPGMQCIVWYKEGKLEKIAELCTDDVERLAKLFGLVVAGRPLTVLQYWLTGPDKFSRTKIILPIPECLK